MDFKPSPQVETLRERILDFMDEQVYPQEREIMEGLDAEVASGVPYPKVLVEIRERAKSAGLWNLFMPDERFGPGLTNWEYGLLCEEMGRSPAAAPMAFNCSAPDTGNMEILAEHGTEEQRERWLEPLLEGRIRSCFSMTEPEVSGSDPTLLQARAVRDGEEWVIDGHKWFTSGAVGAELAIAMVVTDPEAPPYARASMICVPTDKPGFNLVRPIPVMGHDKGPGHCEIRYEECRVPVANLLGEEGKGFAIAQDRLGPGRIHHCMRAIGTAERAHEMMCRRANERQAFGGPLADKQFVQESIATSRMEIDQARLLDHVRGLEDGHRGQARRPPVDLGDQDRRRQHGDGRARPGDPDPRLPGHDRRHPARRPLALQPHAAPRRRPRRGPQDGPRPPRAEPLVEARRGRGGRREPEPKHAPRPI